MKKILSLLLCFIILCTTFGCSTESIPEIKQDSVNYTEFYTEEFYSEMAKNTIIDSGVAKYFLLLPSNASEILEYAATDFNNLIKEASGVSLPIIYENQDFPSGFNYISLGKTTKFNQSKILNDYNSLNIDGFFVNIKDHNYYVTGENDRGVLYGCYDLLKRYVGVRFISADCTHFNYSETVKFAEYEYSLAPEFQQRSFLDYNMTSDSYYRYRTTQYGEFGGGSVVDSPWAAELGNIHTTVNYYVKRSEYYSKHPEFFSSYTNPAADPLINSSAFDDVCYSNGITDDGKIDESMDVSVAKVVLNTIKKYLRNDPSKEYFMIGISDQYNAYCMCQKCKKREEKYGEKSAITTMFVNAIAEEINKWAKQNNINHDINIIQFAYYWSLNPPVHKEGNKWVANDKLVVPHKNVYIRYAPLNANYEFSLGDKQQMQSYKTVVEGWSAISDNLMIYDYCLRIDWQSMYFPHFSNIASQAKYLRDNNFVYWMIESDFTNDGVWCIDLTRYLVTNLWWDVNANVSHLINEFIEIYNGHIAAPFVKQFFALMEENNAVLKQKEGITANVFGTTDITAENYPKQLLEQAITLLDKAQKAIDGDLSLTVSEKELYTKRLTEVRIIPESILLFNYDVYYLSNATAKKDFAKLFYQHTELINFAKLNSTTTVKDFVDSI